MQSFALDQFALHTYTCTNSHFQSIHADNIQATLVANLFVSCEVLNPDLQISYLCCICSCIVFVVYFFSISFASFPPLFPFFFFLHTAAAIFSQSWKLGTGDDSCPTQSHQSTNFAGHTSFLCICCFLIEASRDKKTSSSSLGETKDMVTLFLTSLAGNLGLWQVELG